MSGNYRSEAMNQYEQAQRLGKKYVNTALARGEDPYPPVLTALVDEPRSMGTVNIGLVDIPLDLIVGTFAEGRKNAFAGNFMPLLEEDSEFGRKWIDLCASHLNTGITDPILCYEYYGKFYVQEGHKRVSVLRSYGAAGVHGEVTRIMPEAADTPEYEAYTAFCRFFKLSRTYLIRLTKAGSYARLQAALGLQPDEVWPDDFRQRFSGEYRSFAAVFDQLNGTRKLSMTAGDALLEYLQVHPWAELMKSTSDEVRANLTGLWPDLKLQDEGAPISVSEEPVEKEKPLLNRIFGSPKIHAAFLYDLDPEKNPWPAAHRAGVRYLEEQLGDSVRVSEYVCGDDPAETMEQAVKDGANVLFATSPTLIFACRRVAAKNKNVAVFNCSLSMAYAGVRGYYCRIYESKYIAGAIAGAMAGDDRIGYVADYPIMGVTAAVNAFALGARLTNPRARVDLRWTCLPGKPGRELQEAGIHVISNRDEDGAFRAPRMGLYQVGEDGAVQSLASPRWNWGTFYVKTVKSLMAGGIEAVRDPDRAVNDWWGLSAGVVDVSIDAELPAGVKQLAQALKDGLINETVDPFLCPIVDQAGEVRNDGSKRFTPEELMRMDWLCDNIDGHIPAFDEILPQSQNLVRLLGVYRESIPPKAEETPADPDQAEGPET